MPLKSRGLQMIDEALASMRAGKMASEQNQAAAQQRYYSMLLGAMPQSQQMATVLANPNWQQTGSVTIPPYQKTKQEQLDDLSATDSLDRFPTLAPEIRNAGTYQRAFGAPEPNDVMKTDIQRQTLSPEDFAKAVRISGGVDMKPAEVATTTETNRHNTTEEGQTAPVRANQARLYGAQTVKTGEETRNEVLKRDPTSPLSPHRAMGGSDDDVKQTAAGIIDGTQPPTLAGFRGDTIKVRAELHRQGYDLVKAEQDWHATQKYLSTLNGSQQVRLRQVVDTTYHSLDVIEQLGNEWNSMGLPLLSRANIEAAKSGALGQNAQSLATRLDGQIGDVVSELAVVYKGGNSPTDEGLKLAAKNLQTQWSAKTLSDNIGLVRTNLTIRRNSIKSAGAVTNEGNRYAPNVGATTPTSGSAAPAKRRVFHPETGQFSDQ